MTPGGPGGARGGGRLGLFEGFGVEIEYMIVERDTLAVLPVADRLLASVAGEPASEVERGPIAWSNELALHLLELKTNGPAPELAPLPAPFHAEVREADRRLADLGGRLMPGGVHPFMDPGRESRLWPHEHDDVYRAYDRIFGCAGHGWTNLQSTHLNLPFAGDAEFRRLHAAVRVVLPLVPALAASSPVLEGRVGPLVDERLAAYLGNSSRVPSVAGDVIPEPVRSEEEYRRTILEPIYRDLAPLDPEGVLRHEWVNSRGAIARFDRGSIEVRLLDGQECPTADLAVVAAVVAVVRHLTLEADPESLDAVPTPALAGILSETIRSGERARIPGGPYLRAIGVGSAASAGEAPAGAVWRELLGRAPEPAGAPGLGEVLDLILERGPLARRLLEALPRPLSRQGVRDTYGRLCECLAANQPFA